MEKRTKFHHKTPANLLQPTRIPLRSSWIDIWPVGERDSCACTFILFSSFPLPLGVKEGKGWREEKYTQKHTLRVMNARRVKRAEVHNSRVRSSLKWGYPFVEASARRIKGRGRGRKRKGARRRCAGRGRGGDRSNL